MSLSAVTEGAEDPTKAQRLAEAAAKALERNSGGDEDGPPKPGTPEWVAAVEAIKVGMMMRREADRLVASAEAETSGVRRLEPVDLTEALDPDRVTPVPTVLARTDEVCLFEVRRTHTVVGAPGAGKTFLMTLAARQQMDTGKHVVVIDCEDRAEGWVDRLLQVGMDREVIRELFHYYRPLGAWNGDDVGKLVAFIAEHEVEFVVLDGVTDALSMLGLSSNLDTDVAALFSTFGSLIAEAGPAVVFLDHLTNEGAASGAATKARGSGAKTGTLSGTVLVMDSATPMGREKAGASHVSITQKDRTGHLQQRSVPSGVSGKWRVGLLELDDTVAPAVLRLLEPVPAVGKAALADLDAAGLEAAVLAYVDEHPGCSRRDLAKGLKRKFSAIRSTVEDLEASNLVRIDPGPRNALLHYPIECVPTPEPEQAAQ